MSRLLVLLLVVGISSVSALAQFTDFPTGIDGVPQAKLKGPVHTVLTIEQRGEHVFSTVVEVYDPKGRLIESMNSNAGIEIHSGTMVRLGGKTIYAYDSQARLDKEFSFTPEGEYTGYEVYLYDSQNRLTGTTILRRGRKGNRQKDIHLLSRQTRGRGNVELLLRRSHPTANEEPAVVQREGSMDQTNGIRSERQTRRSDDV